MQDFDYSQLSAFREVKVGDLMKALEGIDGMVRLVDVPAVHMLLTRESAGESEEKKAASVAIAKLASLHRALSLSFSQQSESRDLLMAALFDDESSSSMNVARIMDRNYTGGLEQVEGTRQELLEQAIAHASACGLTGLALELERLQVALKEGAAEAISSWRLRFTAWRRQVKGEALGQDRLDGPTRAARVSRSGFPRAAL